MTRVSARKFVVPVSRVPSIVWRVQCVLSYASPRLSRLFATLTGHDSFSLPLVPLRVHTYSCRQVSLADVENGPRDDGSRYPATHGYVTYIGAYPSLIDVTLSSKLEY